MEVLLQIMDRIKSYFKYIMVYDTLLLKGQHNGTRQVTVQRNSEKLYGKGIPKKLNRKYFPILGLYRYVTYHDTVQESTPGCSCVRNLSMRSDDILYDINKTNAIKRIYLDNYFVIMFF